MLDSNERPRDYESREQALLARLSPKPVDTKDWVALIIEARERLRLKDRLDVAAIFLEACRTREEITIAAVQTCPRWDSLASDEVLAKGAQIIAQVDHPDAVAALATTRRALDGVHSALRIVRRHCEIVVGGIRLLDS